MNDTTPGPARPDPADGPDPDDETRRRLRQAADASSPLERLRLQNGVVDDNDAMAGRLARRYRGRGIADDDLRQVARLGLLKAVRRFDPERRSFAAYAVPTVLGELRRHFRDRGWAIRPSRSLQELQMSVTAARDEVRESEQHEPTTEEVAEHLHVSEGEVRRADAAHDAFAPQSLDVPSPSDGTAVHERIGSEDPGIEAVDRWESVLPALHELDDDDRRLLEMRFVEERTQRDIGAELGISQMQVSRRLTALLERVRERVGPLDG
jgi:RNA polymerase sigma-B factor